MARVGASPALELQRIVGDAYPEDVDWFRFLAPTKRGHLARRVVVANPTGKPTVILMHEAPGLSETTMGISRRLVCAGFRVVMPLLLEGPRESFGMLAQTGGIVRICWHREFAALSGQTTSAIVDWLRCLAKVERESTGTPVGIIGMCFSGGFALGTVVSEDVGAAVMSQPALPFPVWFTWLSDLGVSPAELCDLRIRVGEGACLRGLRYAADVKSPGARLRRLKHDFPAATICEIPTCNPFKHSVLADGAAALDRTELAGSFAETIEFLQRWLVAPGGDSPTT